MTKARDPAPTVAFIDDYCAHYRSVFPNVRQFEQFTRLELGLVAETKRKSLPRLAQTTKADPQAFHHFLAEADWSVEALRAVRLELTRQALRERPFILCIDETGDRKKGKTTDYAAHQYIGNVRIPWPTASSRSTPMACSTPSPSRWRFGSTSRSGASSRATSTRASRSWPSS